MSTLSGKRGQSNKLFLSAFVIYSEVNGEDLQKNAHLLNPKLRKIMGNTSDPTNPLMKGIK